MRTLNLQHTSYILRIWKSEQANDVRLILFDVLSGENWCFADLNGLCGFLSTVMNAGSPVLPFVEENQIRTLIE